jgi:hypothetical protein
MKAYLRGLSWEAVKASMSVTQSDSLKVQLSGYSLEVLRVSTFGHGKVEMLVYPLV